MKKKIFLLASIQILIVATIFCQNRLELIDTEMYPENVLFLEFKYALDGDYFVSDEIGPPALYVNESLTKPYVITYGPRGNILQVANEAVHWPPLIREIIPGSRFAFRINLNKLFTHEPTEFYLVIVDYLFKSKSGQFQDFLGPDDMYTKQSIKSIKFKLSKDKTSNMWGITFDAKAE